MKSKLYLGVALACSAAAAILPAHAMAAEAEGAAAAEPKTAQEEKAAPEAAPVALNTFDVDGVVVTATRMPQTITDVPANVSVITAQEIEDNHYNTVGEALQNVNGVVVRGQGHGEQDVILLNGDERVLVMVDGRRINSDQGIAVGRSTADLRMIPSMKNIDRIEVVKGSASALYGSDAVGGVINIITKKGQKDVKTTIDAAYGAWHKGDYQITNEGSIKDFSWFITGSISRQEYFKTKHNTFGKQKMPGSDTDDKNFSIRMDQKMGQRESVTVNYSHVNTYHGAHIMGTSGYPLFLPTGFIKNGYVKRIRNATDVTWNFKEGSKAPGFLRYYHEQKYNSFDGEFKSKTDGIEYQNGWELGKDHVLIAGIDWRKTSASNFGNGSWPSNGYRDKSINNTAVYVQDTWNISKKWTLVPGLRMDHHNKYGTNWTPKVAVNFTPDKKNQLYTSWGRVFNAPQIDDLYTDGGGTLGNPNLNPEKGYTVNIGWNHEFDKKSSISMSAFYNDVKDAIYWKEMPSGDWVANNFQRDKKRGLEITYKQKLDKHWNFDAGMAFVHREVDEGSGAGLQKDAKYSAPNSYRIGFNYRNRGWFVGMNTTIASGRREDTLGNKHYALIDINASYKFDDTWKIYLKANNLTNQYYTLGTSTSHPGYGRFIQMGVQVSF